MGIPDARPTRDVVGLTYRCEPAPKPRYLAVDRYLESLAHQTRSTGSPLELSAASAHTLIRPRLSSARTQCRHRRCLSEGRSGRQSRGGRRVPGRDGQRSACQEPFRDHRQGVRGWRPRSYGVHTPCNGLIGGPHDLPLLTATKGHRWPTHPE